MGSDSIRISLYDNGEIDGDTVTVFLNGQPVITHQELTARAMNIYLTLDNSKDVNEVSLFAENLRQNSTQYRFNGGYRWYFPL